MERELLHTRRIELTGYKRADGLYDIEGHLKDTKTYDRDSAGVVRRAGEAIHEMRLRITVNLDFVIVDAHAESTVVPYPGYCDVIGPEYKQLIGLTLKPGFTRETRRLFGGVNGCTHLTELIGGVATAAFQTMSEQINAANDTQPFQLDGCHALATDGEAVRKFYPKWFRADATQKS